MLLAASLAFAIVGAEPSTPDIALEGAAQPVPDGNVPIQSPAGTVGAEPSPTPALVDAPSEAPIEPTPSEAPAPARTPAPSEPVTPAAPAKPAAPSSDGAAQTAPKRYRHPLLVIAGGPVLGPHAFGNEECREELARCETTGTFFGVGANVELRLRVWRPLYVHVRGVIVGNAAPRQRDPLYKGLGGGGIGFGAYAKHVFGRAEYLAVAAIGDDHFGRPFGDGEVGRDRWGHHAGLFSVGGRLHFKPRLSGELWGGLMVGPQSNRQLPDEPIERRPLLTFLAGINIAYDLIPARDR